MSSSLIDQIVDGVLKQLAGGVTAPQANAGSKKPEQAPANSIVLTEKVITAELLEERAAPGGVVIVPAKAIITPAARDVIKQRGLQVEHGTTSKSASPKQPSAHSPQPSTSPLLIIVHNTDAVSRLWEDLKGTWKRELTGCPDDAAKLAIAELSRGGASQVLILAQQTFRAACLANRNEKVKAVPVDSIGDIKSARKQIRVNTWCLDPTGKSWFELRNILKSLTPNS